jgi:DDE superfamily endonuclease
MSLSTFGRLLQDFNTIAPLLRARLSTYARAIAERAGNSTQRCVGFIDGTVIEIAKPSGLAQRATYSGHKRRHALKWQAIKGPDGIILNILDQLRVAGTICTFSMPAVWKRYWRDTSSSKDSGTTCMQMRGICFAHAC